MATDEKSRHADTIIRNHSVWSLGAGAIPLALADLAAVSAVQVDMIRSLCEVYEVDFNATKGKALVSSLTSAALARIGAASVVKMVPVAGTLVGSVTGGVLAGASSYALGQAFKTHLSHGGTILDLDPERLKKVYREQFEKGKEKVKEWQSERGDDDLASEADRASGKSRFRFDELIRRKRPSRQDTASASAKTSSSTTDAATAKAGATDSGRQDRSIEDKLAELAKLYERELISEADYEATKARLLSQL